MQTAVQRRPTLLLIIVLSLLIAMMSGNARTRASGGQHTLLERSFLWIVSPIPKGVKVASTFFSDIYYGYIDMRGAVNENIVLRRDVERLTRENQSFRNSAADLARFRVLLGYGEQLESPTTLADILMIDTASAFKSMILDRGSDHGVQINDAVVIPSGLVGRVVLTTTKLSKVQLILDANSAVGCQIRRTRRQAVVRGSGYDLLTLDFVPSLADVDLGDRLITSGSDGIYPAGLPVAVVVSIGEGEGLFKEISCEPAANFTTLEEVLVVHTRKIPRSVMRYQP